MDRRVEMKLYVLQTSGAPELDLHHFIMEALTEERIDLPTANGFLANCRVPAKAIEFDRLLQEQCT